MRLHETTRELTYESFIETFGKEPVCEVEGLPLDVKLRKEKMLARSMEKASNVLRTQGSKDGKFVQEIDDSTRVCEINPSTETPTCKESAIEKMSKHLRKISLRRKDSKELTGEGTKSILKRSKSVSFLGKTSPSVSRFTANFTLNLNSKAERKFSLAVTSSEGSPISKLNSQDYKGYLSVINSDKNSTYTRYWCLFADSCLYCYSSRQDEFATEIISLGGYRLAAPRRQLDVYYVIQLERPGKQSFKLRTDNDSSYKKWMRAFNKVFPANQRSTQLSRSTSSNNIIQRNATPVYERSVSDNQTDVVKSKAQLLEEVLAQQKELIREQQMIRKLTSSPSVDMPSEKLTFLPTHFAEATSMASLTHFEDHGYSSSISGSNENLPEKYECRQHSPSSRSQRSMSTISAASSVSLCSIPEEGSKATDICPKVLAQIEEFRSFSQRTLQRKISQSI